MHLLESQMGFVGSLQSLWARHSTQLPAGLQNGPEALFLQSSFVAPASAAPPEEPPGPPPGGASPVAPSPTFPAEVASFIGAGSWIRQPDVAQQSAASAHGVPCRR